MGKIAMLALRLVGYITKYKGKLLIFVSNLNKSTKLTHWSMNPKVLATQIAAYCKSKSALANILAIVASTIGFDLLMEFFEDDANKDVIDPEMQETMLQIRPLLERQRKIAEDNSGDRDPDTIHGLDREEMRQTTVALATSFAAIDFLKSCFGSLTAAERVFLALQSLEPGDFDNYRKLRG